MQNYRKILIHHMFSGIGDFILGTSAIRLIRKVYPDSHITVLAPPSAAEIIKNNPVINDIIIFDYKSKSSILTNKNMDLLKEIRKGKYDLSISLDCKDRFALIMWLARIPTRVGASEINCPRPGLTALTSKLYTDYIDIPFDINTVHQTFTYQYFVKSFLGIEMESRKPLSILPEHHDYDKIKSLISGLPHTKFKIAYCIKGKNDPKRKTSKDWPLECFVSLMNRIAATYDATQIVIGTQADYEYIQNIGEKAPIYNLAGRTTLGELGALLQMVDLFITVDTGMMHLAASLDVPMIAIFKQSLPVKWAPCSQDAIAIYQEDLIKISPKNLECSLVPSKELSVEDVQALVGKMLKF